MDSIQKLRQKSFPLLAKYPVKLTYLFGSNANNTAIKKSDVDVAVLLDNKLSKEKRFDLRLKLARELSQIYKKEVDLIVLNDIESVLFKYAIITEGKLIYEKSESDKVDLESKTLSLYFDFQPFLDLYNKNYVKANSK